MPGPRIFTPTEASALIPRLDEIFARLDACRERLRTTKLRLNALELIWGDQVQDASNADYHEYADLMTDLKETTERFNAQVEQVNELGGVVKGVEPGLVDFYGVHERRLVFLCWTRGETAIAHWHDVDTGFADRQPLDGVGAPVDPRPDAAGDDAQ